MPPRAPGALRLTGLRWLALLARDLPAEIESVKAGLAAQKLAAQKKAKQKPKARKKKTSKARPA